MATSFQPISKKCRNGDKLGDEIHQHVLKNNRKMDASVLDAIPAGFRKVERVFKTQSGFWGASILNPCEWLGTYNTPEEAAEAYINKMLAFQAVHHHEHERGVKRTGIWYSTKTRKWGASTRNPVTKAIQWVGTYDTIEEAKIASKKKKQISCKKLDFIASHHETSVFKKPVGITLAGSGEWRARIQHPVTKALVHLGTYNTPKEAEDAHKEKELEFERMFPGQRKRKRRAKPQWYVVVEDPVTRRSNYLGMYGSADEAEEALRSKKMELDSMASADNLAANGVQVAVENEVVQVPKAVEESEVVNAYGELIGEYSRIDDELWLV